MINSTKGEVVFLSDAPRLLPVLPERFDYFCFVGGIRQDFAVVLFN